MNSVDTAGCTATLMLSPRCMSDWTRAFVIGAIALWASTSPAAASTTIDISPQLWGFVAPGFGSNFQLNAILDPGQAAVGRLKPSVSLPTDGDYAATLEFLIPALPSNAAITSLNLKIKGTSTSDSRLELRTYIASDTAGDRNRLFGGNLLSDSYVQTGAVVNTDLTDTSVGGYFQTVAGRYIGFSLREISRSCGALSCSTFNILGSMKAPDLYPLPILSVSYDLTVPPPAPGLPEPGEWTLLTIGFGLTGAAIRREKRTRLPSPPSLNR